MIAAELFVSEQPVERKVKIGDREHLLWFREIADADWFRYSALRSSDDVDVRSGARAFLISRSLCEPDGTLALTLEKAASLKLRPAKAIEDAILLLESKASTEAGNASTPGAVTAGSGTS